MKSKNTLKRNMAIMIGLVALCVSAGAAKAQSYKGKFTLTTPVKWDQASLPAGDYTLSLTSSPGGQKFGIVRSESSNLAVMVLPRSATSHESQGGSELRIQEVGDKSVVRSMYISDLGLVFDYSVPKKVGKNTEQIAKSSQRVKLTQTGK